MRLAYGDRKLDSVLTTSRAPVDGNWAELVTEQRAFRQSEVEEMVRVLRTINDGDGQSVFQNNSRGEGKDLAAWKGRLDFTNLVVTGHSFGAALTVSFSPDRAFSR